MQLREDFLEEFNAAHPSMPLPDESIQTLQNIIDAF